MNRTTFNLTQAGRIIGKSRATIQRALASGKLSFELDENNSRVVRADELIRVYGDQAKFERAEAGNSAALRSAEEEGTKKPSPEFLKLQDQLIAQYKGEIERLESALRRAQEGQNLITGLIEDQRTSDGRWRRALDQQADSIVNKLTTKNDPKAKKLKTEYEREINQLKADLQAERDRSLWSKLFG